MAEIDKVGSELQAQFGLGDDFLKWFRDLTAQRMWAWYDAHRDDELVTVGFWFVKYSVKIRHCKPLFKILFGDHP